MTAELYIFNYFFFSFLSLHESFTQFLQSLFTPRNNPLICSDWEIFIDWLFEMFWLKLVTASAFIATIGEFNLNIINIIWAFRAREEFPYAVKTVVWWIKRDDRLMIWLIYFRGISVCNKEMILIQSMVLAPGCFNAFSLFISFAAFETFWLTCLHLVIFENFHFNFWYLSFILI